MTSSVIHSSVLTNVILSLSANQTFFFSPFFSLLQSLNNLCGSRHIRKFFVLVGLSFIVTSVHDFISKAGKVVETGWRMILIYNPSLCCMIVHFITAVGGLANVFFFFVVKILQIIHLKNMHTQVRSRKRSVHADDKNMGDFYKNECEHEQQILNPDQQS